MTPFRRKLLMSKHGSSETLIFEQASRNVLTESAQIQLPTSADIQVGDKLHIVFDWHTQGTNDRYSYSFGVSLRSYANDMFGNLGTFYQMGSAPSGQSWDATGSFDSTLEIVNVPANHKINWRIYGNEISTLINWTNIKVYKV